MGPPTHAWCASAYFVVLVLLEQILLRPTFMLFDRLQSITNRSCLHALRFCQCVF